MQNDAESSLLLDGCRGHVATVILHHVNLSFLGSSLSSWPMHISVECQLRISTLCSKKRDHVFDDKLK